MKKTIFTFALISVLFSCQDDDEINPINLQPLLEAPSGLIISNFVEDGENETYLFDGYTFQFNEDGTVAATKADSIVNGSYTVYEDDGKTELELMFPINSELEELRDDWYFISQEGNKINFEDAGDILQFEEL